MISLPSFRPNLRRVRAGLFGGAVLAMAAALGSTPASAAEESISLLNGHWPFEGLTGTYDQASIQRGFQIYRQVCSGCHAVSLLSYRNLGQPGPGGPGFSPEEVKAIAASVTVSDGPNDAGEMFDRPGRASDKFVKPFPNEKAARAANNGAYPPDLSLIVKAREGGPSYVYSLLQGYETPPADVKVPDGMYYNKYFTGHQIAMPPPLSDEAVTYTDGTKATLEQEAHDIASFLQWAAEPELERRHRLGIQVGLFLIVMTGLLYAVKRQIWSAVH